MRCLLVSLAACEPTVHAVGHVRDQRGRPVAGARVELRVANSDRAEVVQTDSAGRFGATRFGGYRSPFEVRVCRAGFEVARREFASKMALRDSIDVVLESSPVSTAATRAPDPCAAAI